jgi:putative component of membrane protein insertase Oxa1/YidC/SpoIIIJ protein YidD
VLLTRCEQESTTKQSQFPLLKAGVSNTCSSYMVGAVDHQGAFRSKRLILMNEASNKAGTGAPWQSWGMETTCLPTA